MNQAIVLREVLGEPRASELVSAILAERRWLCDASTGGNDDHRRAQILYAPPDAAALVVARIREHVAAIFPAITVARVEAQVTLHGDGDFYRRHADDQGADVARRALSYVYYCHRVPARFSGGELVVYGLAPRTITPEHDTAVIFPSHLEHEVLPVRVPSGDLGDGRISVNGWLWR